jgi:hypothetical protein
MAVVDMAVDMVVRAAGNVAMAEVASADGTWEAHWAGGFVAE